MANVQSLGIYALPTVLIGEVKLEEGAGIQIAHSDDHNSLILSTTPKSLVRVYKDAAEQTITYLAITLVILDFEEFDTLNEFDNVTNYRFVPNKADYYIANACATWKVTNTGRWYILGIFKNGIYHTSHIVHSSNTYDISCNVTDLIYLAPPDYIDIRVRHNDGGSQILRAGKAATFLTVSRA